MKRADDMGAQRIEIVAGRTYATAHSVFKVEEMRLGLCYCIREDGRRMTLDRDYLEVHAMRDVTPEP